MANIPRSGRRPVVLCILDGWGYRAETADNAIALADTPTWDQLMSRQPHALLMTSGLAVGLPEGQMGNSEVGHMNLGAGRVVMQELPRIDRALREGSLATNPAILRTLRALRASGGTAHLLGLLSPGGVHAHQDHLLGLARIFAEAGIPVLIHAFLDGRDTPPSSALADVEKFIDDIRGLNVAIATLSGRYYAMDRDHRWDRVRLAYQTIALAAGPRAADAPTAISAAYAVGKTDEFVNPVSLDAYAGMRDGDGLIMANFRADRAREILTALTVPEFDGFARERTVAFAARLGMTEYSDALNAFFDVAFPAEPLTQMLGAVVSQAGLRQLRIAETEKYAHVTFFFNGGQEEPVRGEQRILIPSPTVATYDLQPEMSAVALTDRLLDAIESGQFDLIVVNYANGDMVGHTGILAAAIKAAETIDACLARLSASIGASGGCLLITADHGNLELMRDPLTGAPYTAHTIGKVPVILVGAPAGVSGLRDGCLADVAPTILSLLGLPQPVEMTGRSLLTEAAAVKAPVRAAG